MSGNELAKGPRGNVDPRVAKTRETLGDALVALMLERPFEQITVKQVLWRAGVGRTTFYEHFRNKDDLFQSDVADFLQWIASLLTRTGAEPRRIAPVEELFAHLSDQRDFHDALVAAGKVDEVRAAGAVLRPLDRGALAPPASPWRWPIYAPHLSFWPAVCFRFSIGGFETACGSRRQRWTPSITGPSGTVS